MPRGAATAGYGESASAPDFLSESRAEDENCAAGAGFVLASPRRWERQIYQESIWPSVSAAS